MIKKIVRGTTRDAVLPFIDMDHSDIQPLGHSYPCPQITSFFKTRRSKGERCALA